jgi:hypothetical protein
MPSLDEFVPGCCDVLVGHALNAAKKGRRSPSHGWLAYPLSGLGRGAICSGGTRPPIPHTRQCPKSTPGGSSRSGQCCMVAKIVPVGSGVAVATWRFWPGLGGSFRYAISGDAKCGRVVKPRSWSMARTCSKSLTNAGRVSGTTMKGSVSMARASTICLNVL